MYLINFFKENVALQVGGQVQDPLVRIGSDDDRDLVVLAGLQKGLWVVWQYLEPMSCWVKVRRTVDQIYLLSIEGPSERDLVYLGSNTTQKSHLFKGTDTTRYGIRHISTMATFIQI